MDVHDVESQLVTLSRGEISRNEPGPIRRFWWTYKAAVPPPTWWCIMLFLMGLTLSVFLESAAQPVSSKNSATTLILYTFSATDSEYMRNLEFFVTHGIQEGDGCDYVIIVQGLNEHSDISLPELPYRARYIYHKNACYDWGTFGWALHSSESSIQLNAYKYFIFMNASVRGPFLPPYWPAAVHWSSAFISKLNAKVKLVGSTISCEPAYNGGDPGGPVRHNAHVQSYVMATDQAGLQILLNNGRIFECHRTIADAVYNAEVGASLAVFRAGHSIDCLMLRYQGIDWTNRRSWNCNARLNPYADYAYDGIGLNPMEVLFVKVKGFQREGNWATTRMAITYDRWIASQGQLGTIFWTSFQVFV
ncbi:g5381 [Coccomyxa elongata]